MLAPLSVVDSVRAQRDHLRVQLEECEAALRLLTHSAQLHLEVLESFMHPCEGLRRELAHTRAVLASLRDERERT
jgi:hypothetical protein